MKKLVFMMVLFVILATLTTCIITKIEYRYREIIVERDGYWNRFLFVETIFNFHANGISDGDYLYTRIISGLLIFNDLNVRPLVYAPTGSYLGFNSKPILSKNVSAVINEHGRNRMRIGANSYDIRSAFFSVVDFGDKYKDYNFRLVSFDIDFGAFNDSQDRFITIIQNHNILPSYSRVVFVDFFNNGRDIQILNNGYWEITEFWDRGHNIFFIKSFKDHFYIVYNNTGGFANNLLKLSNDMTYKQFHDVNIGRLFKYQDFLFTFHRLNSPVRYSTDGESWLDLKWGLNSHPHGWHDINGYLLFYYFDQLYFVENVFDNARLYVLPRGNMEGATITSINKFKDDLAITTTNGIYFKNFDQVMKDKKIVSSATRGKIFYIGEEQ